MRASAIRQDCFNYGNGPGQFGGKGMFCTTEGTNGCIQRFTHASEYDLRFKDAEDTHHDRGMAGQSASEAAPA
jgi:hypothetical protein